MSDGLTDIARDNVLVEADKKAHEAKRDFEKDMSVINADDLLTYIGRMKDLPRGYWKSVDTTKLNEEIGKYQKFIFYETD